MSGDGFSWDADAALADAVIEALRDDPDVQQVFGLPARIFDGQSRGGAFPFAILERHERSVANTSGVAGAEHRLQFAVYSRADGRAEAKQLLGALRAGLDRLALDLPGQRIVLSLVTYSDAMRSRDRQAFRGLVRAKIITEET